MRLDTRPASPISPATSPTSSSFESLRMRVSDDPVPWRLQVWLASVFALAERVTDLATTTLAAKRRSLDRWLGSILSAPSGCDLTRDLQAKIGRARDQLLMFLDHPGMIQGEVPRRQRIMFGVWVGLAVLLVGAVLATRPANGPLIERARPWIGEFWRTGAMPGAVPAGPPPA